MDKGGADRIAKWLSNAEHPRLVIVDVFAKVRGTSTSSSAYDADYEAMGRLKRLADEHDVALLLVHHTRKQAAEDFLSTVSGTNGIAGAADTLLLLSRGRTSADATLQITGRDVEERSTPCSSTPVEGSGRCLTAQRATSRCRTPGARSCSTCGTPGRRGPATSAPTRS